MKAQFRVIGKTERYNTNYTNDNIQYYKSNEFEEPYDDEHDNIETINQKKEISTDWNDDSFTIW